MNRTALMRARRAHGGRVPEEPVFAAFNEGAANEKAVSAPLEALVRYIPAESIALYVGLLGAIGGTGPGYGGRWVAFWIFLAATPVLVAIDWTVRARRSKGLSGAPTRTLLGFNLLASTFAFAAWAFSLPASPFGQISWYDQRWAGLVVLAAAIVLAKAEGLFLPLD
jgi:hypothetical protein